MSNEIKFIILGDTKGLEDALKGTDKAFKSLSKNAGLAFAGLSAAIGFSVAQAKTQEKAMKQTEATLKSTGRAADITKKELFDLASSLQAVTTFADETILEGENMLLIFKEIGTDIIPRATEAMLDMSTALGQDVKASALQLGKALNDPIMGISTLRRAGIQFSDSQENMIKLLDKTGKKAEAQAIILGELERQFGGSAKAAREGFGAIDGLTNSLSDLGEEIGFALQPRIVDLTKAIDGMVNAARGNKIFAELAANILLIGVAITGLLTVIGLAGTGVINLARFFTFLNAQIIIVGGSIFTLGQALGALPLLGAAAFIGWKIGDAIRDSEGLYQALLILNPLLASVLPDSAKTLDEALSGPEGVFTKMFIFIEEKIIPAIDGLKDKFQEFKDFMDNLFPGGGGGEGGLGLNSLFGTNEDGSVGATATAPGDGATAGGGAAGGGAPAGGGERPAFIEGFLTGLSEIEAKIGDIKQVGKDMALSLHQNLSATFSDMILGIKSAKEAFIDFGKAMLATLVKYISEWLSFQIISKAQALISQSFAIGLAATLAAAWAPAAALASLASFGSNSAPAQASLTSTVGLAKFLSIPAFAKGFGNLEDDTLGLFNKRETLIPRDFSDAIRSGELALVGGGSRGNNERPSIIVDLNGATITGITDALVDDIFRKASENIANGTLAFRSA